MPQILIYPQNAELRAIEQDMLPVLQRDDPIFGIMPIEEIAASWKAGEEEFAERRQPYLLY